MVRMPKSSRRAATKGAPYGKRRKSRRKYQVARHPAPPTAKRVLPPKGVSTAPVSPAPGIQLAPLPYILSDLKRIGIIAGILLLLLIILSLVL